MALTCPNKRLRAWKDLVDIYGENKSYFLWDHFDGIVPGEYYKVTIGQQIKPSIKEGVDFVFEQNPELASIGTQEQYSQYLNNIFPDSKVKDIVYHGSPKSKLIEIKGISFWTNEKGNAYAYNIQRNEDNSEGFVTSAIVNIKNPYTHQEDINSRFATTTPKDLIDTAKSKNADGAIWKDVEDIGGRETQTVVFEPEQIRILGSKQDVEGFKEFVNLGNPDAYKSMEVPNTNLRNDEVKHGFRQSNGAPVLYNTKTEALKAYKDKLDYLSRTNPNEYNRLRSKYKAIASPVKSTIKKNGYQVPKEKYRVSLQQTFNTSIDEVYGKFDVKDSINTFGTLFKGKDLKSSTVTDRIIKEKLVDEDILDLVNLLKEIDIPVTFYRDLSNTLMKTDGSSIMVNLNLIDKAHPKLIVEGFIHELVHTQTVNALEQPNSTAEKFLSKRVNYIYNLVKKHDTENRYGFTDEIEFTAELLSKKEFREYVKSLENKTIWNKFVTFIAEFLGIKKGSTKLISELEKYISKESKVNTFSEKKMEVSSKTRKVLEKIINSTATRIKTLENRKASKEAIETNERLKTLLLKSYNDHKDLKGIIDYTKNIEEFTKDFEDTVRKQRELIATGNFDNVLKKAGVIRSLLNFSTSHLNISSEILKGLREIEQENPGSISEIKEIKQVIGSINTDMQLLKNDAVDLSKILFAKFLLPFGMGRTLDHITDVLSKPVKDITFMSKWMNNLQESGDEALAMIDVALKNYYNDANLESLSLQKDLMDLKLSLEKKGIKTMDFLVKKYKGKNTHYFVTERDITQYREKIKEFYDTTPEEEIESKQAAFLSKIGISEKYNFEEYINLLEQKKQEYGKDYDIWFETNTILNPSTGFRVIPKYMDLSYQEILSDPDKKEAYFNILRTKYNLEKHFPESKKDLRRLPQIRKDFVERLKGGNWNRMFEEIKEQFQIKEDETEYGNDYGLTDEAGNVVQFLPIYFTGLVKNPEDLSTDIISTMTAYGYSAIKRDKLSLITDMLELGKEVIKERKVWQTSNRGKIIKIVKKFTGTKVEEELTKPVPGNIYDRLTKYIDMFVYGEMKKEGSNIPYTNINTEKALDAIGRYTGLRTLAGNLYASIANQNTGESLFLMESIQGKFLNKAAWSFANKTYYANLPGAIGDIGKRQPSYKLTLWEEFMDSMNDFEERIYNTDAERKSKVSQMFKSSSLFFLTRLVEHGLHNKVSLGIANDYRYDPDKKEFIFRDKFYSEATNAANKKANELKALKLKEQQDIQKLDKNATKEDKQKIHASYKEQYQSVLKKDYSKEAEDIKKKLGEKWNSMTNFWDAHETKNGRLVLKEGFNIRNYNDTRNVFINRQHSVNNSIQGMYAKLDKNALQYTAVGRLAMMYRKWIVPSFNRRFIKEYTDFEKQMNVEGYYRTFGRFLLELTRDLKSGQFSLMKNWHSLTQEEKASSVRAMSDVATWIALSIFVMALTNLKGEDDDDWALNMLTYQAARLKTELGSLTPPFATAEAFKILNSPAAAINTAQELFYMMNAMEWFNKIEKGKYKDLYIFQRNIIRTVPMGENIYKIAYPEEQLKYFTMKSW